MYKLGNAGKRQRRHRCWDESSRSGFKTERKTTVRVVWPALKPCPQHLERMKESVCVRTWVCLCVWRRGGRAQACLMHYHLEESGFVWRRLKWRKESKDDAVFFSEEKPWDVVCVQAASSSAALSHKLWTGWPCGSFLFFLPQALHKVLGQTNRCVF